MKDCSKLQVFSRGFLQDALTLMKMMDTEGITKKHLQRYIKKPIGNPKPFSKKKNLGCKGCTEKEKALIKGEAK